MKVNKQGLFAVVFFYAVIHLTRSSSNNDPYRWILSRGKPTTQSSTDGSHVASYATDGDYNNYDLPLNYSKTTISDNPYLQVDLEAIVSIDYVVLNFPMFSQAGDANYRIRILVGDTTTIDDPSTKKCFGPHDFLSSKYNLQGCKARGRYLTIQSLKSSVQLSLCEVAVHRRSIESLAYKKAAVSSSQFLASASYSPGNLVDMNYGSFSVTKWVNAAWMRIDLGEIYFVHEVLVCSRQRCCYQRSQHNLYVRVGRSLENNGNSNNLCGVSDLYTNEIKSHYCDVIGRYVNVQRTKDEGTLVLELGEIVVNPETTENVAVHSTNNGANAARYSNHYVTHLTDGQLNVCHMMVQELKKKRVWLRMYKTALVYKVFIANNPDKLDELTDFDIKIGPIQGQLSLCLPGLQSMAGMLTASFFCEPSVSGQKISIEQHRPDKQMSICEIAVFEETKPLIDRKKDLYVWREENKELTLTCDAKAHPPPVLTWVVHDEVVESGSNILQIPSVSRNRSGEYECWANNTHGVDLKVVHVAISSNFRICTESQELKYVVGKTEKNEIKLKGIHWYRFYDPEGRKYLQFVESSSAQTASPCQVWLNGKHPKVQDAVVTRTLCVKNETHKCSTTLDVYIRKCAHSFIYNFKDLTSSSGLTFCLETAWTNQVNPTITSPVANHALSQKAFQTETEVQESYKCLMMCQLAPQCKSFNFSKKLKICELNTATKNEFPKNYGLREDYEYYHMGKGMVIAAKGEL